MKKNIVVLFLLCLQSIYALEQADFIISGNPLVYTILNRYEQSLNDNERELFQPYSPLQVIDKEYTLGDGITSALKVRFCGKSYCLLMDDDGELYGGKKDPYRHTFKKCRIIEDTVKILRERSLLLSQKYPSKGNRVYMRKGVSAVRLFKYQNYFYVKYLGDTHQFGWCSFSDARAWEPVIQTKKVVTTLNSDLAKRIIERIERANQTYEQYFTRFNTLSGKRKSIPQWRYTTDEEQIRCTLANPYKGSDQLSESTQYLVQDIENLLLGKPFVAHYSNGEILVQLRTEEKDSK